MKKEKVNNPTSYIDGIINFKDKSYVTDRTSGCQYIKGISRKHFL